ncbi:MAG: right-handed parallel beta-helix repeat-containing protein, partial [Verrucomicrobiales bacterium]|nr:right-handed parallel beta-helix repeat-containing protein [Verrucomicrobiales bacterium]
AVYHNSSAGDGPTIDLQHCTFADNGRTAVYFYCAAKGYLVVSNCIFSSNPGWSAHPYHLYLSTASASLRQLLVFNPDATYYTTLVTAIRRDPLFMDAKAANYFLSKNSPAMNAGALGVGTLDPDGTAADLGAYGGPDAAKFWPYPAGGPVVTSLAADPPAASQGQTIKIKASATTR